MITFKTNWWLLDADELWHISEDNGCVTLEKAGVSGALQLSVAEKENEEVSEDDLKEFAERETTAQLVPFRTQSFSGIQTEFWNGDRFWKRWWLRKDTILLFVTYTVVSRAKPRQIEEIDAIVASLRKAP